MKAFVVDRYGKHRALQAADVPVPQLREDEVLVQVQAAGVNQLDSKIRDGQFKLFLPYRLPLIRGHHVAGVVVEVGAGVRQFQVGDEVYARVDDFRIGTFAEFVPVKGASLALKPKGLSMEEAASMPLVGLTAWQALVEKAGLKKGQKVFIYRMGRDLGPEAYLDRALIGFARSSAALDDAGWRDLIALAQDWEPPVFPVRAADFLKVGLKPGPALGAALKRAEEAWVEAGFPLEKQALEGIVAEVVAG